MKNLIIIPAYNEQESIEKTVEDIKANAPSFDYIVVNDCSKDNTGKICKEKNGIWCEEAEQYLLSYYHVL